MFGRGAGEVAANTRETWDARKSVSRNFMGGRKARESRVSGGESSRACCGGAVLGISDRRVGRRIGGMTAQKIAGGRGKLIVLIPVECAATAQREGQLCDCAFQNIKQGRSQLLRLAEEGVNKKVMPAV